MVVTLGELAVRLGCELRGDPLCEIDSVATLAEAHPRAVAFLAEARHRAALAQTRAAVVVLESRFAAQCPVATLICPNPRATYARIASLLYPVPPLSPGHPCQRHRRARCPGGSVRMRRAPGGDRCAHPGSQPQL